MHTYIYIYLYIYILEKERTGSSHCFTAIQNRIKILPKSFKIEVWMGIGQLLGASGLQEASQKVTQNLAKIFQTMQNKCTEIDPKTTKNLAKILKIEVWRGSGQLLGASGRQEASQMLPRRVLNASGEALEPILVDFGVSRGRLGAS